MNKNIDRIFISSSWGTEPDESQCRLVRMALEKRKMETSSSFNTIAYEAGGDDLASLRMSFRKAGLKSTQEKADPALFALLLSAIRNKDCSLLLWSRNYASKFWTRIEWKTSLAIAKPILVVDIDGYALPPELEFGVLSGRIPYVRWKSESNAEAIFMGLEKLKNLAGFPENILQGEQIDSATGLTFVKIIHPQLGYIEISKHLITNGFLESYMPLHFSRRANQLGNIDDPAVHVSWFEAQDLCRWLSNLECSYRLPSEVEWEFAARAGNSSDFGRLQHHEITYSHNPVGSRHYLNYEPNVWGICGTGGTVEEWCIDPVWLFEVNGWVNPVIPKQINGHIYTNRAIRGSGYESVSKVMCNYPDIRDDATGFRIVRDYGKGPRFDRMSEHISVD